jgi:hypothetical protein
MSNKFLVKDYSGNDFSISRDGTLEITKKLCFIPCATYLNQIDLYLDPQFPRINSYWKFYSNSNTSQESRDAERWLRCVSIQNVGKLVSEESDLNSQNMTPWVVEASYELDQRYKKFLYASDLPDVWTNLDYPWVNCLAEVRTDSEDLMKSAEVLFDVNVDPFYGEDANVLKDFSNSAGDKFQGEITHYIQAQHVEFDYPELRSWDEIELTLVSANTSGGYDVDYTVKNSYGGLINADQVLRINDYAFEPGTLLIKPWNIEKRDFPIVDFEAPSASMISSAIYYHYSLDFIYNPLGFIQTSWDAGIRASFERELYDPNPSGTPVVTGTMQNTEQLYIMTAAYARMSGAVVSANSDWSMESLPVSEMEVCESYAKTNASNEFLMERQRVLNMTHEPITQPVQLNPDGTVDKDWYAASTANKNNSKRYLNFYQFPKIMMTETLSSFFGLDIGKILL